MSEHIPDCKAIVDRECGPCTCTPGALTREERFDRANVLIGRSGLVASDMDELRGHVGALCRTITQQAQELELTRGAMASQDERERKAGEQCGVPYAESGCDWPWSVAEVVQSLRQQLAAMTTERDAWQKIATGWADAAKLSEQPDDFYEGYSEKTMNAMQALLTQARTELSASQARCYKYDHWTPEHTIEEWLADRQRIVDAKQVEADAQLQATLAAREAEVGQLNTVLREVGWGQGEIDSAAYTLDKLANANRDLVKQRDAAVQEARRYRYLRARATLDKSDKQRITWHIPMWDIPRCYQDIPIKDQLDKDLDEAIRLA